MKALKTEDGYEYKYYLYPEGCSGIEDFLKYATGQNHSFVRLSYLDNSNCRPPFFIREDIKTVYLNIATVSVICEEDVTVLSREDYDNRLKDVIKKKCFDCADYIEGEDIESHRKMLSLNGECWNYEKRPETNT